MPETAFLEALVMRFRPRYTLTTLLLLPVLVGAGIKWYRGPHQYTLKEEREWQRAEMLKAYPAGFWDCGVGTIPPDGTFWAYRNLDGSVVRHGPQEEIFQSGCRVVTHFAGGVQHGDYRGFDKDGKIVAEGRFSGGLSVGEWSVMQGRSVVSISVCDDDSGFDRYCERYLDGRLREEGLIETGTWTLMNFGIHPISVWPGKPHGEWRSFGDEGRVSRVAKYDHGKLLSETWFWDGSQPRERRTLNSATSIWSITCYHENGAKQYEGRYSEADEGVWRRREEGTWTWWDEAGKEIRSVEFSEGVPAELSNDERFVRFFADEDFQCDVTEVPITEAVDLLLERGTRVRIEGLEMDSRSANNVALTTPLSIDLRPTVAFYIGLRDAGLAFDLRTDSDGAEVIVIRPADGP